jgi:hypothetical protein
MVEQNIQRVRIFCKLFPQQAITCLKNGGMGGNLFTVFGFIDKGMEVNQGGCTVGHKSVNWPKVR